MMDIFNVYAYSPEYMPTMTRDDDPLSYEEIEDMKASLDDIRAGRVRTLKAVRAEFGI